MATTQMQLHICKLNDGGLVWNPWHSLQVIVQVCWLAAERMSWHATTIALHALYQTKMVARQPRPPVTMAKDSATGKETARRFRAGTATYLSNAQ